MNTPAPPSSERGRSWVAIILAIGIATAINCITFAVLYDAIFSSESGLSENATQVLTAAFGGIVGVLGAYVGYQSGRASVEGEAAAHDAGRAAIVDELEQIEQIEPPPDAATPPT
jgi:hypothetical protein